MFNPLGAGLVVMLCDQHPNFKILLLALCCLEVHCFLFILLLTSRMFGTFMLQSLKSSPKSIKGYAI